MPPINQQGSRAGLITALVAFVILFVVSLVFAFNFYGQLKQQTINFDAYKKQYTGYLSDAAISTGPGPGAGGGQAGAAAALRHHRRRVRRRRGAETDVGAVDADHRRAGPDAVGGGRCGLGRAAEGAAAA